FARLYATTVERFRFCFAARYISEHPAEHGCHGVITGIHRGSQRAFSHGIRLISHKQRLTEVSQAVRVLRFDQNRDKTLNVGWRWLVRDAVLEIRLIGSKVPAGAVK